LKSLNSLNVLRAVTAPRLISMMIFETTISISEVSAIKV
jgi:hypothetical protein